MIVLGALAPHPPIIVPAVGRGQQSKAAATLAAMAKLAAAIEEAAPETIIVFTPHGNVCRNGLIVTGAPELAGSLARFGDRTVYSWANDLELAGAIVAAAAEDGIGAELTAGGGRFGAYESLDHGVLVPLSFLPESLRGVRLVVVGMGLLPREELYRFGICTARAAEKTGRRAVVLASGDLSHHLSDESPYGYDPAGPEFDRRLVEFLRAGDVQGVLGIPPDLAEQAGECGYRTILMMLGSLDGRALRAEVLGYEGPFGIGYAVAVFRPLGSDPSRRYGDALRAAKMAEIENRRRAESPLVRLARETVEAHATGRPLSAGTDLPPEAAGRAGVFVSIKKDGELRGCIGTIVPTKPDVAAEIRANAIAAAFHDPRFEPVRPDELPALVYSVDILGPTEPVSGLEELDPKRYGVIVRRGGRQGLLLPNLEGIETAGEQVAIARRKAGIGPDEEVEMERFEVKRYY